jgi:hypothetical protein
MIQFSLVDVKNISSTVTRSNFAEADLDSLADIIIESGGIIRPLVVKLTGAESYTVVDGHFEYYAAVRAREKNPRKGEMVNAFVISPKIEDIVTQQLASLKEIESFDKPSNISSETKHSESSRLTNLELRLEKELNAFKSELVQERHKVEDKLNKIESQIPKQVAPLDLFNSLNPSELTLRLINASFSNQAAGKVAESVEKERKKKKFVSLTDVVERVKITNGTRQVKGITSERMVAIIDSWSRLLFLDT